jgi:hypothetical protein
MTGPPATASVAQMAADPSPPERPSERERDVMREIEQATGWAAREAPPDETDREKRNPEESPCPPSAQPSQ